MRGPARCATTARSAPPRAAPPTSSRRAMSFWSSRSPRHTTGADASGRGEGGKACRRCRDSICARSRGIGRAGRDRPAYRPRARHDRRVRYEISQFNRATQAKRQPGSAIKPFVYLAALNTASRRRPGARRADLDQPGPRPAAVDAGQLRARRIPRAAPCGSRSSIRATRRPPASRDRRDGGGRRDGRGFGIMDHMPRA